jgi:signal transduction histidine kinase
MGQTEITIFLVLASVIALIFMVGSVLFITQYRKRKLVFEDEKARIEKQHKMELLDTQVQMQQQTMTYIGREIHDSVAQKLTLASIYAQKMEFESGDSHTSDKLKMINAILNDSLEELRDLSRTLTDAEFQNKGLTELLNLECERVNDSGICKAKLEGTYSKVMSMTVKRSLLRVIQEFMQNSLKHSSCNAITISLEEGNDGLSIRAMDDGKGFVSANINSKGIGLNNMKRRIDLIGGEFNLESEPGKGTNLRLFIHNHQLLPG